MKHEKTAGFDEQPGHERIAGIERQEALDIKSPGIGQPRMGKNFIILEMGDALRQTEKIGVHRSDPPADDRRTEATNYGKYTQTSPTRRRILD